MTDMLDGNTAALRDHENREMARDKSFNALEPRAREILSERLRVYYKDDGSLNRPDVSWIFARLSDDLPAALDSDYQPFLKAMSASDIGELGRLLDQAIDRCINNFIDTDRGQELLEDIVSTLEDEQEY